MIEINHILFWGMFGLSFEILFTSITDLYSKRNFFAHEIPSSFFEIFLYPTISEAIKQLGEE